MSGPTVSSIFNGLITTLENSGGMTSADANALINQAIAIVNLSPTLSQQLIDFVSNGGVFNIGGTGGDYYSRNNSEIINLPTPQSAPGIVFGPGQTPNTITPTESQNITPAGVFVGQLAHELGHYEDSNVRTLFDVSISLNEGFDVGIGLLSEGKATANAVAAAETIAGASGDATVDQILIPTGGNGTPDLSLIQNNLDPTQTNSIQNYADFFATVPTSIDKTKDYLQYYINGWSSTQDANLDPTTITSVAVYENADGTLNQFVVYRNSGPAVTVYDDVRDARFDYNVAGPSGQIISVEVPDNSNISADVITVINSINKIAIDAATLLRLNRGVTSGLLAVPLTVIAVGTTPTVVPSLLAAQSAVYDASTHALYIMGASLNGNSAGNIILDTTGQSIQASLVSTISVSATGITLGLISGTNAAFSIGLNQTGNGATIAAGGGGNPAVAINPTTGSIAAITRRSDGSVEATTSLSVNGLPPAVIINPDGSIIVGLDPPAFLPVVNFAPGGLNGDTEAISVSGGVGVFNTEIGAGATTEVASTTPQGSTQAIFTFTSGDGVLKLDNPGAFTGTVSGIVSGDMINLSNIGVEPSVTISPDGILSDKGFDPIALDKTQNLSGIYAIPEDDGHFGTNILFTSTVKPYQIDAYTVSYSDNIVIKTQESIDLYIDTQNKEYYIESETIHDTFTQYVYNTNTIQDYINNTNVVSVQNVYLREIDYGSNPVIYTVSSDGTTKISFPAGQALQIFGDNNFATAGSDDVATTLGIGYIVGLSAVSAMYSNDGFVLGDYTDSSDSGIGAYPTSTYVGSYPYITESIPLFSKYLGESYTQVIGGGFSLSDVSCYVAGTLIKLECGEVSVEDIQIGQNITGISGKSSPVVWLGCRTVDCGRHPRPQEVWPVRVRAHAFGKGLPHSDLLLSPDHSVYVDRILVPVKTLINGATIVQEPVDEVTYYHVELERHDILLAEGLPCESYLDNGTRNSFANGGRVVQLHPDFSGAERCEATGEAAGCAPIHIEGEVFERVVARLNRQAVKLGYAPPAGKRARRRARPSKPVADLAALLQPAWYLATNEDVAEAGVAATAHYASWGCAEGRLPCPEADLIRGLGLVDPATVVREMPDVVAAGVDPVEHFCLHGWQERRRPNAYFDTGWYLDTHDVPAGMNALVHYVRFGERLGLAPSRHFDPSWYRQHYAIAPSVSALAHYLKHRRTQKFSPLSTFDVAAYRRTHAATMRPRRDPYAHYLAIGQFVSHKGMEATRIAA